MTSREFRDRLARRLQHAKVTVPPERVLAGLESYFELLSRWNRKINLTALPLDKPTDETFDRLFCEPLAASRYFPAVINHWYDLGTGGGSPAIPLKIAVQKPALTMVESKVRKAAFLREAVRTLNLSGTQVENARFEEIASSRRASSQLISVRAVRPDSGLQKVAATLLEPNGLLLLFGTSRKSGVLLGFELIETTPLSVERDSFLSVHRRSA